MMVIGYIENGYPANGADARFDPPFSGYKIFHNWDSRAGISFVLLFLDIP